jgi:hypothetical protein
MPKIGAGSVGFLDYQLSVCDMITRKGSRSFKQFQWFYSLIPMDITKSSQRQNSKPQDNLTISPEHSPIHIILVPPISHCPANLPQEGLA